MSFYIGGERGRKIPSLSSLLRGESQYDLGVSLHLNQDGGERGLLE